MRTELVVVIAVAVVVLVVVVEVWVRRKRTRCVECRRRMRPGAQRLWTFNVDRGWFCPKCANPDTDGPDAADVLRRAVARR